MSEFDAEREANIARNKALLEELDISINSLGLPTKNENEKAKAKPVQPAKRVKRETASPLPSRETRASARLKRPVVNPNETPAQKRKREKEEEDKRKKEEEERLEAEEREREAKRPRHHELDLASLGEEELEDTDLLSLRSLFGQVLKSTNPRRTAPEEAFVYDDATDQEAREVADLKERLGKMKVVARAKVCKDRIYSAAYHPEPTKDIIFFGDKHGQLGIWDARAPVEEVHDDDDTGKADTKEDGKYWRLQSHWPATSKSSISCIKFDPLDAHSVFTSSYDCTVRCLSFTSGLSREVFTSDDRTLIHSIDLPPTGNELWLSDVNGSLTHLDLREHQSKAKRYDVSTHKIGTVSVNPSKPHFILTASNSRSLRIWDARNFDVLKSLEDETDPGKIENFLNNTEEGTACLRGHWDHGKAINSAYWDPRGRGIVSTCYDDKLRFWDIDPAFFTRPSKFPTSRPKREASHDCQTGRWLTVFKAQWSPNPDVYPHVTVGNMRHSLDIFSGKGELLARLSDSAKITAVQAVTCSHPNIVERAASGNGSGRCVLWAPVDV